MEQRQAQSAVRDEAQSKAANRAAQLGIVLVTVPTEQAAETLAEVLVNERLAACVSLVPIRSVYRWQGQLCKATEYQLLIKTDLTQFDALAETVSRLHEYDLPEIVAIPIVAGSDAYLSWMQQAIGEADSD